MDNYGKARGKEWKMEDNLDYVFLFSLKTSHDVNVFIHDLQKTMIKFYTGPAAITEEKKDV